MLNAVKFTVTTTAQKVLDGSQSRPGTMVYFQAAAGVTAIYVGGDNTVATTTGMLVPTALAGGGAPVGMLLGGNEIWMVGAAASADIRILWVS